MINIKNEKKVCVEQVDPSYPQISPFHPSKSYPEYKGIVGKEENQVYDGIRQLFYNLGFDRNNFGKPEWNPLGEIIQPHQQVLIKPNIVLHENHAGYSTDSVITHGSVIRAVADYVLIALKCTGKLIIGDAPLQQCDFDKANELSGLTDVIQYYEDNGISIDLRDFRLVTSKDSKTGIRSDREGDPSGFGYVDLADQSAHHTANSFEKFRVTNYDPSFMRKHHDESKHEYIVANSILHSDVVISLPKLKTHRKAGVTITMKNLIGINGHKDCLPHHKIGSKEEGGDEYLKQSKIKQLVTNLQEFEDVQKSPALRFVTKIPKKILRETTKKIADDKYFEGSWWGNDTIWRTMIDLNNILFFWNRETKTIDSNQQRSFMTIVDGIIAGEGEGPLEPTPKPIGVLLGGLNPAAVDAIGARLMDFDWAKIPALVHGMEYFTSFKPDEVHVVSRNNKFIGHLLLDSDRKFFQFKPTSGWKGHIELK